MSLRGFTIRRVPTAPCNFRFDCPKEGFCITNQFACISHHMMAEESKIKDGMQGKFDPKTLNADEGKDKDKVSEKSAPSIPPPPEKPLPGDCCGSGCVRCVWDVYYEELEEYNRLYRSDSKIS